MKFVFGAVKFCGVLFLAGLAGSVDTGRLPLSEIVWKAAAICGALVIVHLIQKHFARKTALKK